MTDLNQNILKEAGECVKCGTCMSVCPVYKELCDETFSPRGRTALLEQVGAENAEITLRVAEAFSKCLSCERCESVCPKGVPIVKIIYKMRELLREKGRYNPILSSLAKMMYSRPQTLPRLLKHAIKLGFPFFKEIEGVDFVKPRFSLPFLNETQAIPKMNDKFFLDTRKSQARPKSKEHISLFVGCVFNCVYPDIAENALKVLSRLNKEVYICKQQKCCGFPALGLGDVATLKEMALKNCDMLNETNPSAIVTLCSSCALMLKKYYPTLFENENETAREKALKFADKVVDLSAYLERNGAKLAKTLSVKEKTIVTYHQPCHLSKGTDEAGFVKELLSGDKNIDFVALQDPQRCCGYGGLFSYKYPELSLKILGRKVDDILGAKAQIVLTSCSGCIMYLQQGLSQHKIKVLHIVDFMKGTQKIKVEG